LDDYSTNPKTKSICGNLSYKFFQHALANDYSGHKNYGNSLCTGQWILQLDADELPSETLMQYIPDIIGVNPAVEMFYIPRINDYRGVTQDHAAQWGWNLSQSPTYDRPLVNWPDYQSRLYRNDPRVKWVSKLHETINGHNKYTFLPADEKWALYHDKNIETQLETNLRYNTDFTPDENKGHKIG
jgi:glycosyltransferase involved in cell wall biosynthesis